MSEQKIPPQPTYQSYLVRDNDRLHAELARLREALAQAEQERDAARDTIRRLHALATTAVGVYEREKP